MFQSWFALFGARLACWGLWLSLEAWGIISSRSSTPTLKSNLSSPAFLRSVTAHGNCRVELNKLLLCSMHLSQTWQVSAFLQAPWSQCVISQGKSHLSDPSVTLQELSQIYSCAFQVNVFDFALHDIKEDDVLIMATDGLWDVLCNDEVAQVVRTFLAENRTDPQR